MPVTECPYCQGYGYIDMDDTTEPCIWCLSAGYGNFTDYCEDEDEG